MFTSLQYSDIFTGLPVRARISYKTACLCLNAITSSTLLMSLTYICTLLLDLFAPVPTPAFSKFHSINARQKVIMLSVTLVLLSGTHCHCTLEMLQLLTPSSLLSKPISSISKNRISSYLPDLLCVGVCVCGVCVWIEGGGRESVCVDVLMYNYAESERNICAIVFVTPSSSSFMIL